VNAVGSAAIPGLTGAVLAGGQGTRMGRINKALITVGGETLFDRIETVLRQACEHFIVIANDKRPYELRDVAVFSDLVPDSGSLGGLYTAIVRAPTDRVFVCACDMPFVSEALIRHLDHQLGDHEAVVPCDDHGLQPMHAIYSRGTAAKLEPRLRRGELKVEHFIGELNARILCASETACFLTRKPAFFNVNTPADLENARALQAEVAHQA
jgi:molybdopterin-guanine dinucleotide biosynthesis protein A